MAITLKKLISLFTKIQVVTHQICHHTLSFIVYMSDGQLSSASNWKHPVITAVWEKLESFFLKYGG